MCRSSAGWRPSKSSEARTFLGLATSDSPTFAGAALVTDVTTALRVQRVTNDSQLLFGFSGGDWRWSATYGTTGAYVDLAWYTSDLKRMALTAAGRFSVTGVAPGTASSGETLVGGGNINTYGTVTAGGAVESATKFVVNGNDQPVATVALVNVSASSTYDLLTVGDNEMWSLAIGNATEGYMVHAVFGKPSASAGSVMATNNNTDANLTVALVGDILRISNGIGSTRTMLYTLTKLR